VRSYCGQNALDTARDFGSLKAGTPLMVAAPSLALTDGIPTAADRANIA